jgi:hypothetical protein
MDFTALERAVSGRAAPWIFSPRATRAEEPSLLVGRVTPTRAKHFVVEVFG